MAQKISALTVESMNVELETIIDPTGGGVLFAFVEEDTEPDLDSDFTVGEWISEWDIITHKVTAKTPTIGHDSGATVTLTTGTYHVWIRVNVEDEAIVQFVSKLSVV